MMSAESLRRELAALLPGARATSGDATLELMSSAIDPPRLIGAGVVEDPAMMAHRINGAPTGGFRAFLDGTQRSRTVSYVGNVPIVHGVVSAVARERRGRRLHTWSVPLVEERIYAPRSLLGNAAWDALCTRFRDTLVDCTEQDDSAAHPYAMRDAAYHKVQADREVLEQRLAERWCSLENDALFVDGSISGSDTVAKSACAVGVVKSHRSIYAAARDLSVVLGLRAGERTSVFRVTSQKRTTVASWYLRMRDPAEHDPMWGLVRAEIAYADERLAERLAERANEVSRWILAETSPLALPDGRWDTMVYGIRDCEEYLRALA